MHRLSTVILIVFQWLLVLWGLFQVLIALNTYSYETSYYSSLPAAAPGQNSYLPPTFQRMFTGVVTGLISVGVGAILFYLRRILHRRSV